MAAPKVSWVCNNCGERASKWVGQCPSCEQWDTIGQVALAAPVPKAAQLQGHRAGYAGAASSAVPMSSVEGGSITRFSTGQDELDRVLGGGMAEGMVAMIGGNPGAGKSTLLLQAGVHVDLQGRTVLYCTGEESVPQVKDRATRLGLPQSGMLLAACTDVTEIASMVEFHKVDLLIVDSIQTVFNPESGSTPGGVSQLRDCTAYLTRMAKARGTSVVLVGHVTKDEGLAGPMVIKHIVDASLMLSSTEDARYRILRAEKNRFGTASELGVFAMTSAGMRGVENPSAIFLSRSVQDAPGSVVTALWQGTRPLLVEVQALLDKTTLSNPRRVTVGLDDKRVAMLMAVLHKRGGVSVHDQDVYANVVGGVEVEETSADLAIMLAAVGSLKDCAIGGDVMAFGEIGLSGEVRPCQNGAERLKEAAKLGMRRAVVPAANYPKGGVEGMEVYPVLTLEQAVGILDELRPRPDITNRVGGKEGN